MQFQSNQRFEIAFTNENTNIILRKNYGVDVMRHAAWSETHTFATPAPTSESRVALVSRTTIFSSVFDFTETLRMLHKNLHHIHKCFTLLEDI